MLYGLGYGNFQLSFKSDTLRTLNLFKHSTVSSKLKHKS